MSDNKLVISDEAVEAAAKAVYHTSGRARQMPYSVAREACESEARAVLEAAAPHLMAAAWDEGRGAGFRDAYVDEEEEEPNPYRSQE